MITEYLEDLERRLDPDVERKLFTEWQSFTDGASAEPIFSPRRQRASSPGLAWPAVAVNDALDDFDLMALQQFRGCSAVLEQGNGALPCVRANYGTSILPSLFGVELFIMDRSTNTLPTSLPLQGGIETVKALIAGGVPDLHRSLGGRTLEMGRRFVELLSRFPKLQSHVHVYHPDLQGPMDLCEVLWGSSLFMDIMDHPDVVKSFLSLITDTYIAFMRAWTAIIPFARPHTVHWGMLHRGHIMLRDDSAMNFSPAMFEEFIEPYDQRLLDEFGGGAMHFCGRGSHYAHRFPHMRGVHAVAMSQPEHNDMDVIFRHTVDRGIKLIGLNRPAAEQALANGRDLHGNVHCW